MGKLRRCLLVGLLSGGGGGKNDAETTWNHLETRSDDNLIARKALVN